MSPKFVRLFFRPGIKAIFAASLSGALVCAAGGALTWRTVGGNAAAEKAVVVDHSTINERLKGTWVLQSIAMRGLAPIESTYPVRIAFEDDGRLICATPEATYRIIDTGKTPIEIEYVIGEMVLPGVFDVQGDTLTVCNALDQHNLPTKPLPTNVTPGPGNAVAIYSRERP